jgi:hypothetical protein
MRKPKTVLLDRLSAELAEAGDRGVEEAIAKVASEAFAKQSAEVITVVDDATGIKETLIIPKKRTGPSS